jgi:cytochrome b6-f complex iron-sulfur subunit
MNPAEEPAADNGRRKWIGILLGLGFSGSAGSFLYPAIKFMMPPAVAGPAVDEVVVGKSDEFTPNTGRIFKFGNKPGILIRTEDGEWRAFSAVCTHLNCTVQFQDDTHLIWCACHNGQYDLNGNVVGGPPPRPLEAFEVNLRGEDVVVSRRA